MVSEDFSVSKFFKEVEMGNPPRKILVAIEPMTQEEARQAYPYRPFLPPHAESRFGGNNITDDAALLESKVAVKCKMCQAPTKIIYIDRGICPDCDGRAELNGDYPHSKR